MKKIFTVAFLLFMYQTVCAQRNSHNLFWGRLALADTLNSKIKWEVFLQKRTQNNYAGDPNLFNSDQFKSYWLWFHYTLNKNVKISVSPFGYFESFVLNNSDADAAVPQIKEFRWAGRIEYETKGKYFNYSNRYNLEYRLRDIKNDGEYLPNWRVRYMIRLDKAVLNVLSKTRPITFTVYNEIFLQFGEAVKYNPNVFDQNRIYAGASYEMVKNIKLSLGYIYGFQARNSGREFDDINTYWAVLTFDNLISQFKRR